MKTLVLTQAHVEALLSMPECIDVMQRTFAAAVRGEVVEFLRIVGQQLHLVLFARQRG